MNIINKKIEKYLESQLENRDSIFKELEQYSEKIDFPAVGPQVGQLLYQYTKLIRPKRILELGSGFGYSALWFAKGADDNCEIICTDFSQENADLAQKIFEKANVKNKIKFIVGDALEILSELEGEFDIIFNDVDKEEYPETFKASIRRLSKGGILITDNTLWYGYVAEKEIIEKDEATKGILEYNKLAFSDPEIISVILPIRDGITISLKT
ncbi:MAG: O-methyltransferase [Candidatus Thorarchaeota archaeon]